MAWNVVLTSAMPWPSAITWFSAKAMPPRLWQLPMWMCDICDELAGRPVILSSTVIDRWPADSVMLPVAFDVSTGLSLNEKVFGLGEAEWLGEAS